MSLFYSCIFGLAHQNQLYQELVWYINITLINKLFVTSFSMNLSMFKEPEKSKIKIFQQELIEWGRENFQAFLWRETKDPYRILVSEFMLHRTRAIQVEPVYVDFINEYPSLEEFSKSNQREIKERLNTLGLTWRTENLINAMREIHNKYGSVPDDLDKLLNIHGIGQYIAGATVCFSSNQNVSLVDTNTLRVIGRYFGFTFDEKSRKKKETVYIIGKVTESKKPRTLYYAIIDLAHTICKLRDPECFRCPLMNKGCRYTTAISK